MLMAMDEQKELMMALEVPLNHSKTYYCPGCQEAVFLKKGTHKWLILAIIREVIVSNFQKGRRLSMSKENYGSINCSAGPSPK